MFCRILFSIFIVFLSGNFLFSQQDDIEKKLGFAMDWYNIEGQITKGAVIRNIANVQDKQKWPEFYKWLKEHLEAMHRVISPIAKKL